ncbi:MAG: deoxyguanosinetriphosphate triphosphohydrolase [Tissierellaceae bacterium]|nr:deoxyguanosinetriphosphate triphosphohydrolase [Tissierellaceae bacterium]
MNIRQEIEERERINLSPYAMLSVNSQGRKEIEEKCSIRTDFQRDRDRIIHSKSFRRLKHKTQVFIAPEGDHYRTRLTHTLEVSQIGRTIGRALGLNEDLIEAIALGHDLGHTPFGHTGERILNQLNPNGFRHNEQSVRVVDFLEHKNDKMGLNLTYEVREGIRNHTGSNQSQTLEGQVVKYADRIAYINHDIDDAIRAGVLFAHDLPKGPIEVLGKSHGERINNMIFDIIKNSMGKNSIINSLVVGKATDELRKFMFDNVYLNKNAKSEEEKTEYIIEQLFKYYMKNNNSLPKEHLDIYKGMDLGIEDIICDYIAGTTDRFVINLYYNIFIPKPWQKF